MKQFFKYLLASLTAIIVFILIVIVIVVLFGDKPEDPVKEASILHLKLDNPIVDRGSKLPFEIDFNTFELKKTIGLNYILEALEDAKKDERIKGVYLDISSIPSGIGLLEEIREGLKDFKTSGKFIVSYSESYSEGAYYLASLSDKIYLYPEGSMDFNGLGIELMFFKNMLDKLDIEVQIIRPKNNKFKSAVEPFILDKMSDANRAQYEKFLSSFWGHFVQNISESRGIAVEEIETIADSLMVWNPKGALEYNFVDELIHKDEMLDKLAELSETEVDDLSLVTLKQYRKTALPESDEEDKSEKRWYKKDKIAVVYATGNIQSGKGGEDVIASETISKAIREARKDSAIKAIVLRVNSGGGSALASDVIWRETVLAKEAKPFVVSMGDLAASGGYYISANADKIYAQPTTVTGSIGVFGMVPNAQKMLNSKIGVTFDGVGTNVNSAPMSIARPLNEGEQKLLQNSVDEVYQTFLTRVSEGRNIPVERVDEIGQGRVWSGIDALEIGLVDELGGLNDAVAEAAKLAEIEEGDYRTEGYPKRKPNPFDDILAQLEEEEMGIQNPASQLSGEYKALFEQLMYLKKISQTKGVQARLPYIITFN